MRKEVGEALGVGRLPAPKAEVAAFGAVRPWMRSNGRRSSGRMRRMAGDGMRGGYKSRFAQSRGAPCRAPGRLKRWMNERAADRHSMIEKSDGALAALTARPGGPEGGAMIRMLPE